MNPIEILIYVPLTLLLIGCGLALVLVFAFWYVRIVSWPFRWAFCRLVLRRPPRSLFSTEAE